MKQLPCPQHPNRFLTNFCCASRCMLAMCPQCLPGHLRAKQCDNLSIEYIDKIYDSAMRKSEKSLQKINEELDLLKNKQSKMLNEGINAKTRQLKEARARVDEAVAKYFATLESEGHFGEEERIREERIAKTIDKYQRFRDEIKDTHTQLANYSSVDKAIKTMITLDMRSFFMNLRQESQYLYKGSKPVSLEVSPSLQKDLNAILERSIKIKKGVQIPVEPVLMQIDNKGIPRPGLWQDEDSMQSGGSPKTIYMADFFEASSSPPMLHYFQPLTKSISLFPLNFLKQNNKARVYNVQLACKSVTPQNHRSIVTPQGTIYLFGGKKDYATPEASILMFQNNPSRLDEAGKMLLPRHNHALAYCDNYIYVISGETNGGALTSRCEKFNIRTRESTEISGCNYPVASAAICLYKERYLIKFGGRASDGRIQSRLQRYDIKRNTWDSFEFSFSSKVPHLLSNSFTFTEGGMAVQINHRDIQFSCGVAPDSENSSLAVLREVGQMDFEVNEISQNKLPVRGTYVSGTPVIQDQFIHAVVKKQYSGEGSKYGFLVSDGSQWQYIQ